MATDINLIIKNLSEFYDPKGRIVVSVGAGGGQMVRYAETAAKVLAIDNDETAVAKLKDNLKDTGLSEKFEVICADFYDVAVKGDVVLFEFCLHEMSDPVRALKKAKELAKDIVIYDHLPGKWSYYTAESEKIERSWKAVHAQRLRREKNFEAVQLFKNYDEIYEKLRSLGEPSLTRIEEFRNLKDIKISMPYAVALI